MKTIRNFSFVLALVMAFGALTAHAADVRGKFTLVQETHWGSAILPAGDYVFALDSTGTPAHITLRHASGDAAALVIAMTADTYYGNESRLALVNRGGATFVSALYVKGTGTEFRFLVPAESEKLMARQVAK